MADATATSDVTTITDHEAEQVEPRTRNERCTPVVFVHGLWLLPSSWDRWAKVRGRRLRRAQPGWPDDPDTVARGERPSGGVRRQVGRRDRRSLRDVIGQLEKKPAVGGHPSAVCSRRSWRVGAVRRSVAIDPAPFRGVLPLPISALKSASPVLGQPGQPPPGRPAHVRPVPLRVRERGERGRGQGAVRDVRGAGLRAFRSSRPRRPT